MRKLLLCPPDYYGIEYEINPWMSRARKALPEEAKAQWEKLRDQLRSLGCPLELIRPQPSLPDMVFTANAGLVVGRRFIRSNFRYPQRRGEQSHFEQYFADHGYEILHLPDELFFEGEGDALFAGSILFCGYRFRSDIRSHRRLGELLRCLVVSVELVDDRFYHLDTCFCPLADGGVVWFPPAFDDYARRAIRKHIKDLVEVVPEEAMRFACNAVTWDREVVLPDDCPRLCAELAGRGLNPHPLGLSEFLKAGGACKCLVLWLPQQEDGN